MMLAKSAKLSIICLRYGTADLIPRVPPPLPPGRRTFMSRVDCISNRNIRIVAAYVDYKLGNHTRLFDGLQYPTDRYSSPDDFFLNEDEWTSYDNFQTLLRRGKAMVGEPYFYFCCGASAARLRSWGRLDYFVRFFTGPNEGFKRLAFFTKHFTDTKDVEILVPPAYNPATGKIRTVLEIRYHSDIDVHTDYAGDAYSRGILSAIPTIWGLKPATVRLVMNPYDPEVLFREEPDLASFGLEPKEEGNGLTVKVPGSAHRKEVGRKVFLIPEQVQGKLVFLGKYSEASLQRGSDLQKGKEAFLITETVEVDRRLLLRSGEIFRSPSFVLDVTYDRLSMKDRLLRLMSGRRNGHDPSLGLVETINELKKTIVERNQAYRKLEKINMELQDAKARVDDYARNLEIKVAERTNALQRAQDELTRFNQGLEAKVKEQVEQLRRYDELRRYLSPKLSESILSSGDTLGGEPKRKMMTVVFTDIRNFSSFTESLEPEELFPLMDKYLSEMTGLIHRYDGTLNKIIGDGLLIFFGDPITMEDHAEKAVMMAVDMQKKADELKDEWLQYGHDFGIGIGINTGYMTVGNIGSDIHKDYTVIGNQVNVASRLESLAKAGQILISQRTYSRAKKFVEVEEVGKIQVQGLRDLVVTYNVKTHLQSLP
jgi:class 3 adenylate cyclase